VRLELASEISLLLRKPDHDEVGRDREVVDVGKRESKRDGPYSSRCPAISDREREEQRRRFFMRCGRRPDERP
jgi:hypothetical protein